MIPQQELFMVFWTIVSNTFLFIYYVISLEKIRRK